jgi:hypothetical protein
VAVNTLHAGAMNALPFMTPACIGSVPPGPVVAPSGTGTDTFLYKFMDFFVSTANAQVITQPDPITNPDCEVFQNPLNINLFTTFGLVGAQWKGCVMARDVRYDANDVPPIKSNPSSLFVPFFFPDEADNTPVGIDPRYDFDNDWLDDNYPAAFDLGVINFANAADHTEYFYKYEKSVIRLPEDWNSQSILGPNRGCSTQLLTPTNNIASIQATLNDMKPMKGTGTLTSEGLAWAWRVLSPGEPFPNPHPYAKGNKKYIVLFTDGDNGARQLDVTPILTDFTAYMWSRRWQWLLFRPQPQTVQETMNRDLIRGFANDRVLEVAENIRNEIGTEIFVVLYDKAGTLTPKVKPLYEQVTGKPGHVLVASNLTDLRKKFLEVAALIMVPRLLPDAVGATVTPPPTP